MAVWALLPPYTGPYLATETRVEVADHVVPAAVVLTLSLLALTIGPPGPTPFGFAAGLGVLLAGFWMTATHIPLVAQATRGQVSAGAAAYHTLPGLAVAALGMAWACVHWSDDAK